jgi:glycosyltransferase involved in cell wall biosynthesis
MLTRRQSPPVEPGRAEPVGRRLLLVAYFYPPCTDTGAHRPTALAKYLRRAGHDVTVLSTSAYGSLPGDGDREHRVERTSDAQLWRARLRGAERIDALYDGDTYAGKPHPLAKLIVPEPLAVAWAPFARRRARRLARAQRFDAVITTSPPESAHSVGRTLQRGGAAWVADVRDAWTFEPLRPEFAVQALHRWDERMERRVLGAADVVTCVSEPAAADLRARGIADPVLVRNGADPELLAASDPASVGDLLDPERVSLVYTGRFGSTGRDPRPLVEGLARLATEQPGDAARLELVVAGPLTEDERLLFSRDLTPARVRLAGTLERERALALQRAADCLLLIAHPVRSQLANFKLYEYLSAGPPILALAAGTEAGSVATQIGARVEPAGDPAAIARALAAAARGDIAPPNAATRAEHSYPAVAERMAAAVELAISRRGGA